MLLTIQNKVLDLLSLFKHHPVGRGGGRKKEKMEIKATINGKEQKVTVREFNGIYQILTGPYAMGIIRKDEVINENR